MTKQEIKAQFPELVESGNAFVYNVEQRVNAKGDTVYDYSFAQQRKAAIADSRQALYDLRGMDMDNILLCWYNGVPAEAHAENVKNGVVAPIDDKGNFNPIAAKGIELYVEETTDFDATKMIYFSKKRGEVAVREPKKNPRTGAYPTLKGQPIYRTVLPVYIEKGLKDVLVTADGSFTSEELESWTENVLAANKELVDQLS